MNSFHRLAKAMEQAADSMARAAQLLGKISYTNSVHTKNGGTHLVTQEGIEKILSSSTGEIFLDNLFETDYLLRNVQMRVVNSASYSVNIAPNINFTLDDSGDPLAKLNEVETYVQLMSQQTFCGRPVDDALLNWADSEYDTANRLVDDLIDNSKQRIKRTLAFRSSGVVAKITDVETYVDPYTAETFDRYILSSVDNIVDGEEVRLASQDSVSTYALGSIKILDAERKIVSIRSHRRAQVGDNILITPRAGMGIMGMYEMFVGERIFNSKRTAATTPAVINAKAVQSFDELVTKAKAASLAGSNLVAYMSSQVFSKLDIIRDDLHEVDTGYDIYYEYHGIIIAINDFLKLTDSGKHYFLLLDLDTLTLNCSAPLRFVKDSSNKVYFVENTDPVANTKTLQLFAQFEFQLTCSNFSRNTVVEFNY